jgi:hypothetical protein
MPENTKQSQSADWEFCTLVSTNRFRRWTKFTGGSSWRFHRHVNRED